MNLSALFLVDAAVFVGFVATVVLVGVLKSRHEKDSESYFLAGRGLSWWLIGFSLIAANISTEQFVGQSGQAADYIGLAIASYEWLASITLVAVAFFFLPKFLRSGIYTISEFLEYRYNHFARALMSLCMMAIYVGVTISAVIYSGALTVDVLFGGEEILGLRPVNLYTASWVIGTIAAVYVVAGGLKACAWADLLQGSALIVGGALVLGFALHALGQADPAAVGLPAGMAQAGGFERFRALNAGKLHMVLPRTDPFVPWTALLIGLWVPNFYYWGLNQYIVQRTLGARSLGEGQKGVVFAAALKLCIPFIIIFPGMIAFNLFREDMKREAASKTNAETLETFKTVKARPAGSRVAFRFKDDFARLYPEAAGEMMAFNAAVGALEGPPSAEAPGGLAERNEKLLDAIASKNAALPPEERIAVQRTLIGYQYDSAFGLLIKRLIPAGVRGFLLAAILGAVVSSLAAMLNAASTIFTMDLYQRYLNRGASQANLVAMGRICVVVFAVTGCLIAPLLGNPRFGGIFTYIQEFQGFVEPGILSVFLLGLFVGRTPRICGVTGLVLGPLLYGILMAAAPSLAFLDRIAVTFFLLLGILVAITLARPLKEPVTLPVQTKMDLQASRGAMIFGVAVVLATMALYVIFR